MFSHAVSRFADHGIPLGVRFPISSIGYSVIVRSLGGFFFVLAVASLAAVLVVACAYYRIRRLSHNPAYSIWFIPGVMVFGGVIFNCIPDYLSVVVSRAIVRLMAKTGSVVRVTLLLVADIVIDRRRLSGCDRVRLPAYDNR